MAKEIMELDKSSPNANDEPNVSSIRNQHNKKNRVTVAYHGKEYERDFNAL